MNIRVALLPQLLPPDWARSPTVAIVIDTLRFTSTACIAIQAGANSIAVMSNIEAARGLAIGSQPRRILCGERHCTKISGFDLGNSPLEYVPAVVGQRQLIFSTTNGTVAVEAAQPAQTIALGSLLNRNAIAQWLIAQSVDNAWLVCAGTDGQVAQEDVLTAGAILDRLVVGSSIQVGNDSANLARDAWRSVVREGNLLQSLLEAQGGRNLVDSGFLDDVEFVAQLDRCDVVPRLDESRTSALGCPCFAH